MENILMALFGGGIADWDDLSTTNYDWGEIFDYLQNRYGELSNVDINDIYETILNIAKDDFCNLIENFIDDYTNEDTEILKEFDFEDEENWDIWCNCLDTHITLFTTAEIIDIIKNNEDLEEDIAKINDKIGFTYIRIEEN